MQQDSATLIYNLNTMKGTTESYLKKIAQSFQTLQFQAWKIVLSSQSLEKNRKLFWATLNIFKVSVDPRSNISASTDYFDNVITKFIFNNNTDVWKTAANLS